MRSDLRSDDRGDGPVACPIGCRNGFDQRRRQCCTCAAGRDRARAWRRAKERYQAHLRRLDMPAPAPVVALAAELSEHLSEHQA